MVAALRERGHDARVIVPRGRDGQHWDVIGALGTRGAAGGRPPDMVRLWSPDVIHVQFAVAAFGTRTRALLSWLRFLRSATQVPVVATMHEVTRDTAALRGPGRALYRKLAAHCDHVIVHTRDARAVLTGQMGVPEPRVTVIPHPQASPPGEVSSAADLRGRFGLGDAELLLAFGFVHVDKGLDDLERALGTLRRSGALPPDALSPDRVRLIIAGTVRPRQGLFRIFELRDRLHLARVLRMARRDGIVDLIVRTGYVPEADVAGWFRAAAAVVLPYRRTEQSGVASLAAAFRAPVLASTAGGLGDRGAPSRWVFPPRSPGAMAAVIARFLDAPPEERAEAARGRADADMNSVAAATLGVYDRTTMTPAAHVRTVAAPGSLADES
jgi:glycogen(starch) synthase